MSGKVAKNTKLVNTLVSAATSVPFIKSIAPHTFHVSVHAKPGARQSAIVPPVTRSLEYLEVRLAAPPVDGAANAELVNLLEEEITREWRELVKTTQVSLVDNTTKLNTNYDDKLKLQKDKMTNTKEKISFNNVKKSKVSSSSNSISSSNKISVSFVKGTTSRSKIVAVEFPGDAEELFAILERIS